MCKGEHAERYTMVNTPILNYILFEDDERHQNCHQISFPINRT